MNNFVIRETTLCSKCNSRVMVRQLVNNMAYPTISMQNTMSGCCNAPVNFIVEPRYEPTGLGGTFTNFKTIVSEFELSRLRNLEDYCNRKKPEGAGVNVVHDGDKWSLATASNPKKTKAKAK